MPELELIIGNKNYSSWSMRAWLFLKESQVPFTETRIPLYTERWHREIAALSPTSQVPVLKDGELTIWDSWAICDYVREKVKTAIGWPEAAHARAIARAVSAEMHSGFLAIRQELPLNCRLRHEGTVLAGDLKREVHRVETLIRGCRERFGAGGPYLFGEFCTADIVLTPLASRFLSYGIHLGAVAEAWMAAVLGRPTVRQWLEAARAEVEVIARAEPS